MKSNSITGLSLALFPADTSDQTSQEVIDLAVTDGNILPEIIVSSNNFYLFEGDMPAADTLKVFEDSTALLAVHSAKLIMQLEDFDIRYTYDKIMRRRKIEKWPVDAQTFKSKLDGNAKWALIELSPKSLSVGKKLLIFTDAVGGWSDDDQSVLISSTAVVAGENITVKSINITIQDTLVSELI